MSPDNKKFIAMVVGLVITLIAVFVFVLMQLFASNDTAPEQTISAFPESGDRTDLGPVGDEAYPGFESSTTSGITEIVTASEEGFVDTTTIPESLQNKETPNWQDTIVDYGEQTGSADYISSTTQNNRPTYSVDDLIADGLVLDYDMYKTLIPKPKTFKLGDGREISMDALNDQKLFAEAVNPFPSLVSTFSGVKSCGTLQVPSTESGVKKFLSNLSEYEESACLGGAIINDCQPAWALVNISEQLKMWVYVAERTDGLCGMGITGVQEYVGLCDVAEAANLATGKDLSLDEWQEMYADTPAELFAEIYSSESEALSPTNLDCVDTRVK